MASSESENYALIFFSKSAMVKGHTKKLNTNKKEKAISNQLVLPL